MGIGLSIVFTGLCALVAEPERGTGQVLLVDAKGLGEVGGVTLPEHSPTLVVSLASLANAESSGPSRVVVAWPGDGASAMGALAVPGQIGLWDLSGSEVRIRIQGGASRGLRVFRASADGSSWPKPPRNGNDPEEWRDMRYIADMNALTGDGRIDPSLLATNGERLPSAVAARFRLDSGLVEAGIPSHESHRDDWFEFRGSGGDARVRQALTDSIRWSVNAAAGPIVIEIAPVGGDPVRQLVFKPSAIHQAFVSNLPVHNRSAEAHHALDDNEMAALHFGAYYKLLKTTPTDVALPAPWSPPRARGGAGVIGPFLCPPAAFTRD